MNFLNKLLSIVTVLSMLTFNNLPYLTIYAQEESPISTESPQATTEPEIVVENIAEVVDTIDSNSNTGENEINIAVNSPVPTEISLPTESPSSIESPISTESPQATTEPIVEIVTSDSISLTEIENNVNSNSVNSEFIHHTLNIYLTETGDIDLSKLTANVINKVYGQDSNLSEVVNLRVTTVDNFAYIDNEINSISNTGSNSIESADNSSITTGNAYSIVSVLNNINTNIIDSKMHVVTINIFGTMTGNIILPEINGSNQCTNCSSNNNLSNEALVNNQINSTTNTGENKMNLSVFPSASPSAEIKTGQAVAAVNVLNLVNLNFINTVFRYVYINILGTWVGNFLGILGDGNDAQNNVLPSDNLCINCGSNVIGGTNFASVNNTINSTSDTGNNLIKSESKNNKISTGDAYSSVSLINMVNTNVINSTGFVGFVNIFGTWNGNIGGADFFVKDDETDIVEEDENDNDHEDDNKSDTQKVDAVKESGGILEVTHSNNVGTHVLPGDTVTFFAKTKNVGNGKIYNVKLSIELSKDGIYYGGADFVLGDIGAQKTVKLTTGLVMSKLAPSGKYLAKIVATGVVGPDNTEVTSVSESEFKIFGYKTVFVENVDSTIKLVPEVKASPEVLGAENNSLNERQMYLLLVVILLLYLALKIYQKKYNAILLKSH